jgi:hypothetical protein
MNRRYQLPTTVGTPPGLNLAGDLRQPIPLRWSEGARQPQNVKF